MNTSVANRMAPLGVLMLLGSGIAQAQDDAEDDAYPDSIGNFDNPTEIEQDLEESFPKQDAVFPQIKPQWWPSIKRDLYQKYGLKVGFSYQSVVQQASDVLPGANDTAAAGWVLLQAKWELVKDDEGDAMGSLVVALDGRDTFGSNAVPGLFRYENGSIYATEVAYFEWDPYLAIAFWEQWLIKDELVIKAGQVGSAAVFDFFRFGEVRTQFSNSELAVPPTLIPFGATGPGVNVRWSPKSNPGMYVVGTVTDMNAPVGKWDWGRLTDYGQVFAGIEIGKNWRRSKDDFDHAHVSIWYGDEKDTAAYPTEAGWGLKLHGSKQWDRWIGFGSVGYNDAYGGGFGFTNSRAAANAGFGYLRPFGIRGEIAAALTWTKPFSGRPDPILGVQGGGNQYGFEGNWRLLLTPDLWIAPGIQFLINPTFNPDKDLVAIPQFKFKAFF